MSVPAKILLTGFLCVLLGAWFISAAGAAPRSRFDERLDVVGSVIFCGGLAGSAFGFLAWVWSQ